MSVAVAPDRAPPYDPDTWAADPRPDLAEDTARWAAFLNGADHRDGGDPGGLFGALHGLRCKGARLVVLDGRVRLDAGEVGPDYPDLRHALLVPHTVCPSALLAEVQP